MNLEPTIEPAPPTQPPATPYTLTRWLFLRLLGAVYLIAFASLWPQILGLVGSQGLLPTTQFLDLVRQNLGAERYWLFPTLAWLNASDPFLQFLVLGGAVAAVLVIADVATLPALAACWIFFVSLVVVGQAFLSFQWDGLLLEAGFLALLWAPWQLRPGWTRGRAPSRVVLWLLRLLLFRLMFSSGVIKLLSGDPLWRHLTALTVHYETQPLPTPLAWYLHQLPVWFQKASCGLMFFLELVVPFFYFAPRRLRFLAGGLTILFQVAIALSGNYTYFNLLTIVLCLPLFDDAALRRLLPQRQREATTALALPRPSRPRRILTASAAGVLVLAAGVQLAALFAGSHLPRPAANFLVWMEQPRLVNSYGLFAVMTPTRPEIVIQGSNDGQHWQDYVFPYKPGPVDRAPSWVAPYQPRLDWQLWFAALSNYQSNPWFVNLMLRLLQGSPPVLRLLEDNPFPQAPPRYVRALLYQYHFTDPATRRQTGAWWRRERLGLYFPPIQLRR